jgi:LPS export ABC transporter protein LptC
MVPKEEISVNRLSLFLLPFLFIFAGCGNDAEMVKKFTHTPSNALMSAKFIDAVFSDSGMITARITSPLVNRFSGENPYMEFPKGFMVEIYDSALRRETTITADYGKRDDRSRIMEAKGNVVVRNEIKNEQLNTESLTWDEPRHTIFSRMPVKISTPGKVLFGEGLESNENFSRYTIIRPKGQMSVPKDSL